MILAQKFVVVMVIAMAMLSLAGCRKKKPALPAPQVPTITVPVQPTPPPEAATTAPSTTPSDATTTPGTNTTKPAATKPKPKHHPAKKTATATTPAKPAAIPADTTVAKYNPKPGGDGNGSGVQLSADVPQGEATQRKQETNQLLEATETNIRKVGGRSLNDFDQATMRQIRNYITQSRLAVQDGDLERAYNLATKANLLCNELVKRL